MKKLLLILMALALLPLSPAMADESAAGTWYFVQLTLADYSVPSSDAGIDMMLLLSENGEASSETVSGPQTKETTGSWTQNGNQLSITLDGKERTGTITDDGTLVLGNSEAGEQVLTFSRTALLGAYYTPAEPIDASLEQYLGEWKCDFAKFGVRTIALSSLDSAAELNINARTAIAYIRNTVDDETTVEYDVSMQDSALKIGNKYTVQLLQDDVLLMRLDSGAEYYFERMAAQN